MLLVSQMEDLIDSLCSVAGITAENCSVARDLGFDGVAVLGSIWQSPDPVAKCRHFLSVCSSL